MSNLLQRKVVIFDGFWERDGCIQLLSACGRFNNHEIIIEVAAGSDAIPAGTVQMADTNMLR